MPLGNHAGQRRAEPEESVRSSRGRAQPEPDYRHELSLEAERVAHALTAGHVDSRATLSVRRGGLPAGISSSLLARMAAEPIVIAAGAEISANKPQKSPLRNPARGAPAGAANVFSRGTQQAHVQGTATSFRLPKDLPAAATARTRSAALLRAADMVETFAQALLAKYKAARQPNAQPRDDILFDDDVASPEGMQPFTLVVRVWFGDPADSLLRLHYQFDTTYRGYIVAVSEKRLQSRTKANMSTAFHPPAGEYSSKHDPTGSGNLTNLVNQGPGSWDAMTKIAGEAPRFQCVKRAAQQDKLRDDLIFHNGTIGIPFDQLWLTWTEFKGKYGITDQQVKDKLTEWDAYSPAATQPKTNINAWKRQTKLKAYTTRVIAGGFQLQ